MEKANRIPRSTSGISSQYSAPPDSPESSVLVALCGHLWLSPISVASPIGAGQPYSFLCRAPSALWDRQPGSDKRKTMVSDRRLCVGLGDRELGGVLVPYSRHTGVTLFFEGWSIQLPTQHNLQNSFYNKNAKYDIFFWFLFFPAYLKQTFVNTFINKETIFG